MTQREFFTKVIATTQEDDLKAYAENAITKLDERNANRKNTLSTNQKENEKLKVVITEYLTNNKGKHSAAEVATNCNLPSTSKASALLTQLIKAKVVGAEDVRITGKGKHKEYFILEKTENEEEGE